MNEVPPVYADTSALGALLVEQSETSDLLTWLDQTPATLVACDLLETELRRMAVREGIDQSEVTSILEGVSLAVLDRAVFRSAGLLPMPYLHTLEALHLEAAMRLEVDAVLTYDHRLAEAARSTGLDVITHGRLASCDGYLESEGRRIDFSHALRFASTSKTAKIAEVRSYCIETRGGR